MPFLRAAVFATLVLTSVFTAAAAQAPDEGYSREQLQPLTKFRRARSVSGSGSRLAIFFDAAPQAAAQENHRAGLRRITLRPRSCLALTPVAPMKERCVYLAMSALRHVSSFARVSEDGRLCAAAFVQNRKSYTGCTDAPNPSGESGRPWCYVEAQAGTLRVRPRRLAAALVLFCSSWTQAPPKRRGTFARRSQIMMVCARKWQPSSQTRLWKSSA